MQSVAEIFSSSTRQDDFAFREHLITLAFLLQIRKRTFRRSLWIDSDIG